MIYIIGAVITLNIIVLAYLTLFYFKNKDNTLQDDGAANTEQEN